MNLALQGLSFQPQDKKQITTALLANHLTPTSNSKNISSLIQPLFFSLNRNSGCCANSTFLVGHKSQQLYLLSSRHASQDQNFPSPRWESASCITNSSFVDKGKASSASISGIHSALRASIFIATRVLLKSQNKAGSLLNSVVHLPQLCPATVITILSLWIFTQLHHEPGLKKNPAQITIFVFTKIVPLACLTAQPDKCCRGKLRGWKQGKLRGWKQGLGMCWNLCEFMSHLRTTD